VKGLFRRGKAYQLINELEKAKEDFTKALEHDKNNTELKTELHLLREKMNASKKNEQKFYGGMFEKLDKAPSLYKEPENTLKKCTICGEEMEALQWARHVIKKHGDKTIV
jgi:tetratricopeptide (TPR) repeat protein